MYGVWPNVWQDKVTDATSEQPSILNECMQKTIGNRHITLYSYSDFVCFGIRSAKAASKGMPIVAASCARSASDLVMKLSIGNLQVSVLNLFKSEQNHALITSTSMARGAALIILPSVGSSVHRPSVDSSVHLPSSVHKLIMQAKRNLRTQTHNT